MSRIDKTPITVPAGVDITIGGPLVTMRGKKGELSHTIPAPITVVLEEGQILVSHPDGERVSHPLHGLARTLIANIIVGVTEGYKKSLEITGTDYHVVARGKNLEFALGFSYPIIIKPARGIEFAVKSQTKFTVYGIDKQLVSEMAARIRRLKKPEPYKSKDIHYVGETIRHEVGRAGK